ncbi:MAG: hypothetical protein HRU19_25210 [Pseudobacteriovorax sp.]|nr:hypothetical protein [Pseudobacteriovorax sp.]
MLKTLFSLAAIVSSTEAVANTDIELCEGWDDSGRVRASVVYKTGLNLPSGTFPWFVTLYRDDNYIGGSHFHSHAQHHLGPKYMFRSSAYFGASYFFMSKPTLFDSVFFEWDGIGFEGTCFSRDYLDQDQDQDQEGPKKPEPEEPEIPDDQDQGQDGDDQDQGQDDGDQGQG